MKGGVGVYIPLYITWLQIAVECLHDCCHLVLPCALIHAGLPRDAAKGIVMAWGESRSTKPCVFLFKVAAAGDEGCLVCAVGLRQGCLVPRLHA